MNKINDNGVVRDMTPEEIAEMESLAKDTQTLPPTPEERLAALEQAGLERDAALMELAALLTGGV